MPANVETMFSVRIVPWHGLGTIVQEALSSEEALEMAGLNWDVIQKPIFAHLDNPLTPMGLDIIEGYKVNTRSTDNAILGVVSDQYQVVQNRDAFAFVDELIGSDDVKYETAGSLAGGKRIWLLAKMPDIYILDDAIAPFLVFTTGHDGRHLIRCAITPIRVVCQNTLNIALQDAQRSWSTKHTGDMNYKLEDARDTLGMAQAYMENFSKKASDLASKYISEAIFKEISEALFPMPDDLNAASLQAIGNVEAKRSALSIAYRADDIAKFTETGWGVINAISDMATHNLSSRQSQEALFSKTIDGHPLIDKAYDLLLKV